MADGGTSFWKIFLGVLAAILAAGAIGVAGCVALLGGAGWQAAKAREAEAATARDYVRHLATENIHTLCDGPSCHLSGGVRNKGTRTVRRWKVEIRFLDGDGAVVDRAESSGSSIIEPGESAGFDVPYVLNRRVQGNEAVVSFAELMP